MPIQRIDSDVHCSSLHPIRVPELLRFTNRLVVVIVVIVVVRVVIVINIILAGHWLNKFVRLNGWTNE